MYRIQIYKNFNKTKGGSLTMKRRHYFYLVSILVFFVITGTQSLSSSESSKWDDDYYERFCINDFKDYSPANRQINFNDIDYNLINAAVFYETNRMRVKQGFHQLKHSRALENSSQMHSIDMVNDDFFDHYNHYDSRKREPSDRMAMFGVTRGRTSENIADVFGIQYKSGASVSSVSSIPPHTYNSYAEQLVDDWMHSPGHRKNILDSKVNFLGCGNCVYQDGEWIMFKATQNFASIVPDAKLSTKHNNKSSENSENSNYSLKYTYEEHGGGVIVKLMDGTWKETASEGIITYVELDKDDKYFYLHSEEYNFNLAIPIEGGMAYYLDSNTGKWKKFGLVSAVSY